TWYLIGIPISIFDTTSLGTGRERTGMKDKATRMQEIMAGTQTGQHWKGGMAWENFGAGVSA
ncbi:MAG TPA: hypothetical protein VN611_07680, partial [Patescibacteria group bacterium]|nr:hypothetical protein [Patescibacteria group bacterium]